MDTSKLVGHLAAWNYFQSIDTAENKKFVDDFKAKHGGYPSFYAAQAYDAIMLIASAVKAVGGDMSDKDAVRAALKAADFNSVRGKFKFGTNNMPVQDFVLREVIADADGNWTTKVASVVYTDHVDSYAADCKLK